MLPEAFALQSRLDTGLVQADTPAGPPSVAHPCRQPRPAGDKRASHMSDAAETEPLKWSP